MWCSDEKCRKEVQRQQWIKKVYDLEPEEYVGLLEFQGNVCAICQRPFRRTPHVDHEHGGHVRGICCGYCNTRLIGRLKNPELAQRLADYLLNPPAVEFLGEPRIAPGRPKKKRQPRKRGR